MTNQMTAVLSNSDINRDTLLGYMAFYYLPGIRLKQTELEDIFSRHMMPLDYLPEKIYGHDAFRRVTSKIRGSIDINFGGGTRQAKLTIDEVRNDDSAIVRVLGRKIADASNDTVDYVTVGAFKYDKATENVTCEPDYGYGYEADYEGLVMIPATHSYTDAMVYHNRDTVRTIVSRIFKAQNPVSIIKGAYFIPKSHEDELMALRDIVTDLSAFAENTADLPDMRVIPLLDTAEQRELVEKRASFEFARELDALTE